MIDHMKHSKAVSSIFGDGLVDTGISDDGKTVYVEYRNAVDRGMLQSFEDELGVVLYKIQTKHGVLTPNQIPEVYMRMAFSEQPVKMRGI